MSTTKMKKPTTLPTLELLNYSVHSHVHSRDHRALKRDITAHGVRDPLIVRTDGQWCYLYDGHQRVAIAQELRIAELPVIVEKVDISPRRTVKFAVREGLAALLKKEPKRRATSA